MGNLLSCFFQILFLTCVPLFAFGLAVFFCRWLFISLVGTEDGRPLLVGCFALSTPLRELGHAIMAVLFMHRITDACFLNVHDANGELGFIEHSYHPRNPVAILGNFFYAIGPLAVGLFSVWAVLLLCFGDVMSDFAATVAALGESAGVLDYLRVSLSLLPAMVGAKTGAFLKVLGGVLLLLLCMGIFVSLAEAVQALGGFLIYAGLVFVFSAVLSLFDPRLQRILLDGLRGFATGVTALFLVVLLAVGALLAIGCICFLLRTLRGGRQTETALQQYRAE